jgi:hypothetical protein
LGWAQYCPAQAGNVSSTVKPWEDQGVDKGKPAQTVPAFWVGAGIAAFALAGPVLFAWSWWRGDQSLFVINGSYVLGASVLFGLGIVAMLGQRSAQRMGGPALGLALAGLFQLIGVLVSPLQPLVFKLTFLWYLNLLYSFPTFNGLRQATSWLRRKLQLKELDRPGRIAVLNGFLTQLWLVVVLCLGWRVYDDRLSGMIVGLWPRGWPTRALVIAVIAVMVGPIMYWRTGSRRPRANPRDAGLEARLRRIAYGGTVVAAVFAGATFAPAPAWAEMPNDRILLEVQTGPVTVGPQGQGVTLARGDRRYVSAADVIQINDGGWARLTFRGGSSAVLCSGSSVSVGPQSTVGSRPATPIVRLSLTKGRILADTSSHSPGFAPLRLTIESRGEISYNDGPAQFAVRPGAGEVVTGRVSRQGEWLRATGAAVTCAGPRAAGPTPSPGAPKA